MWSQRLAGDKAVCQRVTTWKVPHQLTPIQLPSLELELPNIPESRQLCNTTEPEDGLGVQFSIDSNSINIQSRFTVRTCILITDQ